MQPRKPSATAIDVREITRADAKAFVAEHHYSGTVPTAVAVTYGAFVHGRLYAVAMYGFGANPNAIATFRRLSGILHLHRFNTLELSRLCRRGSRGKARLQLTAFIARCHRLLTRDHGIRFVISYSDPEHGHDGGIYKAANFQSMGETQPERHGVDATGKPVHRRKWYRVQGRDGVTAAQARATLKTRKVKSAPKNRWLIRLDQKGPIEVWD
jgi:hypothetical protein